MDSSDNNPGEASERPIASDIAASGTSAPEVNSSGEATPHAEGADGAPRPRRRRRRRRRPGQAGPAPAASAGTDAAPDGEGGEGAGEPATREPRDAAEGDGEGGDRPILRLRTRRRRHRRPPGGAAPEGTETASEATAEPGGEPPAADAASPDNQGEGVSGGEAGETATRPLGTRPARSRNRRRRRPPVVVAKTAEGEVELRGLGAPPADRGAVRPPGAPHVRSRRPRRRAPGDRPEAGQPAAPSGAPGAAPAAAGQENRGPREGDGRRDNRGGRDNRRDGRPGGGRSGGRRDGPPGRGPAPRPVERKLYAIDAVVDRGFEDIEDEEGGEARRVSWTIVKRTTADQITRKPVATVYVLQRDGVDAEFPSLGAARSAVNKTIVHPEKLTRSRAEHLAAKK